jgi:imidazolonepropionase-like amidohydrolase
MRTGPRFWLFACAAAAALPVLTATQAANTGVVILRAARVLDVRSGTYSGPSDVRVQDGRIASISAAGRTAPAGSTIDLGDLTVLPGLTDAHVHLQIGATPEANAQAVLQAGFTTAIDLGATSDAILRLRDAIAAGSSTGPRLFGAGLWAGTKDGICEFGGIGVAGGPDAFRRRVRENVAAGADLIKVCVSGWTADAFQKPLAYEIADDALAAVVDEAHRAHKLVVAHAISLGSVKAALRAGVDGLAHAAFLDADTARQLHEKGVFLIPTLASLIPGLPADAATALRDSVRMAHQAGVRIVFGTDGGVLPHGRNAREFVALANAGIPAIDAIRAATVNATAAFALRDVTASVSISMGARADVIAVEGDPLQDLTALSRVRFVMQGGRVIVRP